MHFQLNCNVYMATPFKVSCCSSYEELLGYPIEVEIHKYFEESANSRERKLKRVWRLPGYDFDVNKIKNTLVINYHGSYKWQSIGLNLYIKYFRIYKWTFLHFIRNGKKKKKILKVVPPKFKGKNSVQFNSIVFILKWILTSFSI